MKNKGEILFYRTDDNQTQIEVRMDEDTVWLTQNQMVILFDSSKSNISEHIKAVFAEGELIKKSTVRKFRTVQNEGRRIVTRNLEHYNLDVIISVGYRVKSLRGTQFRIWSNKILKDFLLKGYALNEKLLSMQKEKLNQLNSAIKIISSISSNEYLAETARDSFLFLLEKYSEALNILDNYDYKRFSDLALGGASVYVIQYDEVKKIIEKMKSSFVESKYFGREKDESLNSSISAIYQTFDGVDLYPSIEEKSANLLYFLVKNHTFVDGNKRIAASIFLYFLDKNELLDRLTLDNGMLVALTLMIANSKPSDKDILINIIALLLQAGLTID